MMLQPCKQAVENVSPSKTSPSAAGAMSFQPKKKPLPALEDQKPESSSPHKATAFVEAQEELQESANEEDEEKPLAASAKVDLEKKLFETLKKNKREKKTLATAKAKAKGKAKGKAKAKSMKKPAAHGSAAAGSKQSTYEVPPPTKEQLKARRESYTDLQGSIVGSACWQD